MTNLEKYLDELKAHIEELEEFYHYDQALGIALRDIWQRHSDRKIPGLNWYYQEALNNKEDAKKPVFEGDGYYDGELVYGTWHCPNCDETFEDYDYYDYCPNCGQHIDWSEEEL